MLVSPEGTEASTEFLDWTQLVPPLRVLMTGGVNPNCATLTEAWHTDGTGVANNYGTLKPMGQRDYYPYGGRTPQPGCNTYKKDTAYYLAKPELLDDPVIACSHGRATKYFIQSVENDCFGVRQICTDENNLPGSCSTCLNCPNMGYVQGSGNNGKYYLDVNPATPHCQG